VFPFQRVAFDWIHLHSLALTEMAFELRRRTGARIAYTAHSIIARELERGPVRRFWSDMQLRVMKECDAVIFVSESERDAAFELAPEVAARARVIGNAVPAPARSSRRYNPDGPVVFAGRFTESKGMALLRELLPRVHSRWPGHFVMAGGHADEAGNQAIRDLRMLLGDALSLPGWLSRAELDDLFAEASLVLVPSCYEPFGMVAVEAMRMGAPVLAARVGGLTEIVRAESGARLVGSRDPDVWRRETLDILHDQSAAGAMARRGPEYVKCRFNPSAVADRLMREVYAN
jgi:1,4-alpha-glucan branching enzyme